MKSLKMLRNDVYLLLGERLSPMGFKKKPKRRSFERNFALGKQSIHFAYINHQYDFNVICDVEVRLDMVEDIRSGFDTHLTTAEKAERYTLGAELGNIAGIGTKSWEVSTEDDVEPVVSSILTAIHEIGMPALEEMSSPELVLKMLLKEKHLYKYARYRVFSGEVTMCLAYKFGVVNDLKYFVDDQILFLEKNALKRDYDRFMYILDRIKCNH